MRVITYDDGSKLLVDDAGQPAGAIDTDGNYVPYLPTSATVGKQLESLLSMGVSQALSKVLGGKSVTTQAATTSAPASGITTSTLVTIGAGLLVVVGLGLGIAAIAKG